MKPCSIELSEKLFKKEMESLPLSFEIRLGTLYGMRPQVFEKLYNTMNRYKIRF